MKEIKIVREEVAEGAKPEKGNRGYGIKVVYTLEDGQQVCGYRTSRLLRDLKAEVAKLPREVHNMAAKFNGNVFWGTISTYTIGASGLQERSL